MLTLLCHLISPESHQVPLMSILRAFAISLLSGYAQNNEWSIVVTWENVMAYGADKGPEDVSVPI